MKKYIQLDVQDQLIKLPVKTTIMSLDNHSSIAEGAAWTRKAGKNKEGGLNEKGRKSYERENPGKRP